MERQNNSPFFIIFYVIEIIYNAILCILGNFYIPSINLCSVVMIATLNNEKYLTERKLNIYESAITIMLIISLLSIFKTMAPKKFEQQGVKKKVCYNNLRCIQSAVEIYELDRGSKMQELDMDILLKNNFIKTKFTCPRPGVPSYKIINTQDGVTPYCLYHGPVSWKKLIQSQKLMEAYKPMRVDITKFISSYKGKLREQDLGPDEEAAAQQKLNKITKINILLNSLNIIPLLMLLYVKFK